jgi:hypothetical protein
MTGKPALEVLEPKGAFAYLQDWPDEAEIFARAMTAKAILDVNAVIAAYDFARWGKSLTSAADVGICHAGHNRGGAWRRGILFDLPMVIDTSTPTTSPRLTLQACDFFVDALTSADAYILMEVLHDWPGKQCGAIVSAIPDAAPDNATVLVVEDLMPEEQSGPSVSTVDVIMLTMTGGRERTVAQLRNLFEGAGFDLARVIDTSSSMHMHIVEARPT